MPGTFSIDDNGSPAGVANILVPNTVVYGVIGISLLSFWTVVAFLIL